jgi:hypothetical protein
MFGWLKPTINVTYEQETACRSVDLTASSRTAKTRLLQHKALLAGQASAAVICKLLPT